MSTESKSRANKELMQQIFADVSRGDPTSFYERLDDNATLIITGEYSWSQTIQGKERISRDLYGYVRSRLSQRGKTHAFHFLADDDWVVVEARGDMMTKEGQPYQNHYCMLYRLAEGRIVEIKEYQDSTLCERLLGPYPTELKDYEPGLDPGLRRGDGSPSVASSKESR